MCCLLCPALTNALAEGLGNRLIFVNRYSALENNSCTQSLVGKNGVRRGEVFVIKRLMNHHMHKLQVLH